MSDEKPTLRFNYVPSAEQVTVRRLDDGHGYLRVGMTINLNWNSGGVELRTQALILDLWVGQFRVLPARLIEFESPAFRSYSTLLRGMQEFYPNIGFVEETMVIAIHYMAIEDTKEA